MDKQKKIDVILQLVISLIIAFQICGYNIFFERVLNVFWIMVFVVSVVVIYFFIDIVIRLLERMASKAITVRNYRKKQEWFVFISVLIIGMIFIGVMYIAYYPGIYSQDVVSCWEQSKEIANEKSDIHSFLYVCMFSVISKLTNNIASASILFSSIFLIVFTNFMTYLWKKGIRYKYILMLTVLFYLLPTNLYMPIGTWKDEPFTIGLLAITYFLTMWAIDIENVEKSRKYRFGLYCSAICVACFRSNGMVVLGGVALVFAIRFICWRKDLKIFVTLSAALISVLLFKGPIFSMLNVDRGPEGFACVPFVDAVWANAYYGEELPQEIETELAYIVSTENWKNDYKEDYSNVYIWKDAYWNDRLSLEKSIEWYIWCLRENPKITIRSRLNKTEIIWNYFLSESASLRHNCAFDVQNGLAEKTGWFYSEQTQCIRDVFTKYIVFWDNVAFIYCGALSLSIWLIIGLGLRRRNKSKAIIIILPAIFNTLALLFACCYGDYRYIWYMEMTTFFVLPVYFLLINRDKER